MMKEGNSKKENSIFILDETFDFDLLKKYPNFNSSIIISLDFKSHIKCYHSSFRCGCFNTIIMGI